MPINIIREVMVLVKAVDAKWEGTWKIVRPSSQPTLIHLQRRSISMISTSNHNLRRESIDYDSSDIMDKSNSHRRNWSLPAGFRKLKKALIPPSPTDMNTSVPSSMVSSTVATVEDTIEDVASVSPNRLSNPDILVKRKLENRFDSDDEDSHESSVEDKNGGDGYDNNLLPVPITSAPYHKSMSGIPGAVVTSIIDSQKENFFNNILSHHRSHHHFDSITNINLFGRQRRRFSSSFAHEISETNNDKSSLSLASPDLLRQRADTIAFESDHFVLVSFHHWAVLASAIAKYRYRILLKNGPRISKYTLFRIVAQAKYYNEIIVDWRIIQRQVEPLLTQYSGDDLLDVGAWLINCLRKGKDVTFKDAGVEELVKEKRGKIKQVDDFTLGKTLGRGSHGVVYLGSHPKIGKVAIKMVLKSKSDALSAATKEVALLKDLRHPRIAVVEAVIRTPKYVAIILEYCENGDLLHLINASWNNYLEETHARHLFYQMVQGLQYLHANSMIHRDIKPDNILLDQNGDVKITDFGLARFFYRNEIMTTRCGSLIYAAPELINKKYINTQVDVWSLGVVLYNCITGRMPFDLHPTMGITNIYKIIKNSLLDLPEMVSDEVGDLVKRMLVVDPDKRITLNEIVLHPWISQEQLSRKSFKFQRHPTLSNMLISIGVQAAKELKLIDEEVADWKLLRLSSEVQIYRDQSAKISRLCCKSKGLVMRPPNDISRFLKSHEDPFVALGGPDNFFNNGNILEQVDPNTTTQHLISCPQMSPSNVDVLYVLHHQADESKDRIIVVAKSFHSSTCPEVDGVDRIDLLASGWILQGIGASATQVTFILSINLPVTWPDDVVEAFFNKTSMCIDRLRHAIMTS